MHSKRRKSCTWPGEIFAIITQKTCQNLWRNTLIPPLKRNIKLHSLLKVESQFMKYNLLLFLSVRDFKLSEHFVCLSWRPEEAKKVAKSSPNWKWASWMSWNTYGWPCNFPANYPFYRWKIKYANRMLCNKRVSISQKSSHLTIYFENNFELFSDNLSVTKSYFATLNT